MTARINYPVDTIAGYMPDGSYVFRNGPFDSIADAFAAVGIIEPDDFDIEVYANIYGYGARMEYDCAVDFDWRV